MFIMNALYTKICQTFFKITNEDNSVLYVDTSRKYRKLVHPESLISMILNILRKSFIARIHRKFRNSATNHDCFIHRRQIDSIE